MSIFPFRILPALAAMTLAIPWVSHAQTRVSGAVQLQKPLQSYPERAQLWEKTIAEIEARDKAGAAPTQGAILFVGSSSIRAWKSLAEDFPKLPVFNRGFGGSQIPDSTYYANRLLLPFQPRTVVFYAGDNDIAAGHTHEQVVGNFQTFALKVRAALPDAKIIFLAIKPSLARWKSQPRIATANRAIAGWMASQPNMTFVDVHTPMLGADGQPRKELYLGDGLHMTPAGYKLWTSLLAPHLMRERLERWMCESDDPLLHSPVALPPGAVTSPPNAGS